jgi:SagB-type dehydrogenase family enzyme
MFAILNNRFAKLVVPADVSIELTNDRARVLLRNRASLEFDDKLTVHFLAALRSQKVESAFPPATWAVASMIEAKLIECGAIALELRDQDMRHLLTLSSQGYNQLLKRASVPKEIKLHPLSYIRVDGDRLTLKCVTSNFHVEICSRDVLDAIISAPALDLENKAFHLVRQILWAAGLVVSLDEICDVPYWSFEDLLFHTTSRGRADYRPRGATYPYSRKQLEPKQNRDGSASFRYRRQELTDVSFETVLTRRRSVRGELPALTCGQICSLLSIATAPINNESTCHLPHEVRPYPSAGGVHELEFFVVVNRAKDLQKGVYRFCEGRLVSIEAENAKIVAFLEGASEGWGTKHGLPAAVIVLISNIPMIAWKYQSIAYRLALLNAGAAMQTICQVAYALGIGACPLGTGDSQLFSEISKASEWVETSIVEIALAGKL